MVRPVIATSTVIPNHSVQESCLMIEYGKPSVHSGRKRVDQRKPSCPANRERDILKQDLEMFWAYHNSTGLQEKVDLPHTRIKRVMKSNPQVKMVGWNSPVLLAKACDIFIQEGMSPQGVVHGQLNTPANVDVPKMKAPIDIDQIQQQSLYNLTADDFIEIGNENCLGGSCYGRETQLKDGKDI
ncbi:PREDICTED: nuclear transcription factor Y subunit C-8-like [Camelina sativa]|uniref:Nuclear transcription factor Y subunit C-8-like n=1 Tax=Camelina sativa TaxID=90675 RepID=A0ABM1QQV4_CAMSA|nr:PREDICTED: nuclear transcription factor Y subunit C-8-like [Camelina sativa]